MALEETIKRAKEMHRLRTEEKLSLQKIGDKFGLSRERVRQICVKYERVFLRRELLKKGELRVVVMGDLQGLVSSRVWQFIRLASLQSYPVQSFLDNIDLRDVMNYPNVGKQTVHGLLNTLEKAGYDVSHLRSARNWQNYDASEYRRESISRGNIPDLYRIPSLHAKSSAGSQGAGLPEI